MSITITSAKKKIFEVHNIATSSRNHIRADIDPIVSLFSNLDRDRKVCQVCVESKNLYTHSSPPYFIFSQQCQLNLRQSTVTLI